MPEPGRIRRAKNVRGKRGRPDGVRQEHRIIEVSRPDDVRQNQMACRQDRHPDSRKGSAQRSLSAVRMFLQGIL